MGQFLPCLGDLEQELWGRLGSMNYLRRQKGQKYEEVMPPE